MPVGILAYLTAALQLVPLLISAGRDIGAFATEVYDVVTQNSAPTDAQWLALHQKEDSLRIQLQAPLPAGGTHVATIAARAGLSIPGVHT